MLVKLVEEVNPYTNILPSSVIQPIDSLEELILFNWPLQEMIKYGDTNMPAIDYCEVLLTDTTPSYPPSYLLTH